MMDLSLFMVSCLNLLLFPSNAFQICHRSPIKIYYPSSTPNNYHHEVMNFQHSIQTISNQLRNNNIDDESESSDDQEDLTYLRSASSTSSNTKTDLNSLSNLDLEVSREIVLTLKAYIDEAERDLFSQKWSSVCVYLDTISEQVDAFVDLIDNLFPSKEAIDIAACESMEFEAKSIFLAIDDLRDACVDKNAALAERSYAKLLLSYDRFLKAGDLYPTYDVITSTEIFFKDTPLNTLRFDELSPINKLDRVVLKVGPDMGKVGTVIYIDGENAIVKLDKDGREYQEVKRMPFRFLAKDNDNLLPQIRKKLNI